MEQIFGYGATLADKGWTFSIQASFLEIYNERIRDLLAKKSNSYLEIQQRNKGNKVEIPGLITVPVETPDDVFPLLKQACINRSVASTDCNDQSSRSHSVFQLYIRGENKLTEQKRFGLLNLVDLAGSERLKRSNAQGQRLKETQAINKSLSALGDVIHALAKKKGHVPYRNSKLTHLLMDCFGGDCKTLMFINLCPERPRMDESLNSLRFAAKVNETHVGVAKKTTQ